MLRVILDDQPLDADCKTLAAAVGIAIDHASRAGRIVLDAEHEGVPLAPDVLAQPPDSPAEGVIRFISADPRTLVAMTLEDAASAMASAGTDQVSIAHKLQSGEIEPALQALKATIGHWQTIQQALHQAHLMLQLPACREAPSLAEHAGLAPALDSMARELDELKDAITREDWSLLGDLLAHELPPRQRQRETILRELATSLAPLH